MTLYGFGDVGPRCLQSLDYARHRVESCVHSYRLCGSRWKVPQCVLCCLYWDQLFTRSTDILNMGFMQIGKKLCTDFPPDYPEPTVTFISSWSCDLERQIWTSLQKFRFLKGIRLSRSSSGFSPFVITLMLVASSHACTCCFSVSLLFPRGYALLLLKSSLLALFCILIHFYFYRSEDIEAYGCHSESE